MPTPRPKDQKAPTHDTMSAPAKPKNTLPALRYGPAYTFSTREVYLGGKSLADDPPIGVEASVTVDVQYTPIKHEVRGHAVFNWSVQIGMCQLQYGVEVTRVEAKDPKKSA